MRIAFLTALILCNYCHAAFGCEISLLEIGAVAGDIHDPEKIRINTERIQDAFRFRCPNTNETLYVDGGGEHFSIQGSLDLNRPSTLVLSNAGFLQKSTGLLNVRTLFKNDGRSLNLKNIYVHRGMDKTSGHRNESAGIWVQIRDSELRDIEITGDGSGQGLFVVESSNVVLNSVRVHDLHWAADSMPEFEALMGIRIERSDRIRLENSRVSNLLGYIGKKGAITRSQSDGITAAGTRYLSIINTTVEWVGEGIDLTGSLGNAHFEIRDSTVSDAHSFGFKFANATAKGQIRDSVAYRSGLAGFVFSGKNGRTKEETRKITGLSTSDIVVRNCKAINTGHRSDFPLGSIAGFRVMQGLLDGPNGFPRNIRIEDSQAINDREHHGKMRFGFHSETRGNFVRNVDSIGHATEGTRGFDIAE